MAPARASAPEPPAMAPASANPPPARPAAPSAPDAIAREVLDALAMREGEAITTAAARGNLFATFGPQLFAAFEEYRRRAGGSGAAPFRAALRERWNVDLPEVTPRG